MLSAPAADTVPRAMVRHSSRAGARPRPSRKSRSGPSEATWIVAGVLAFLAAAALIAALLGD